MTAKKPGVAAGTIEDVLENYSKLVYKLAYTRTKNKTDAEDLFQEVFLKYLKSNPQFASEEHCRAWLIKVTINSSKNLFASMWRKRTILRENLSGNSPGKNNDRQWEGKSEVFYAVMKLPEKYRIVVHLYYHEDYSVAEIGKILRRNESTVKTQLHRARKLLKKDLRGDYDYV